MQSNPTMTKENAIQASREHKMNGDLQNEFEKKDSHSLPMNGSRMYSKNVTAVGNAFLRN
jgi:hypothetical protein